MDWTGEAAYSQRRTGQAILEVNVEMTEAMKNGNPYLARLDPPAGSPRNAEGIFRPLPEWLPGQQRPANWPSQLHLSEEYVS